MASGLTLDLGVLERGLADYWRDLTDAIEQILVSHAETAEQRAKSEHAWQNQTGAAEAGLNAGVIREAADAFVLYLQHGEDVPYGFWLEVKYGGRLAVIDPVLSTEFPAIMAEIEALLR